MPIRLRHRRPNGCQKDQRLRREVLGSSPRTARSLRERLLQIPSFAGLVVLAGSLNPIPSRTRPLNFPAPMVVRLKTRESRSLPGLPRTEFPRSRSNREKSATEKSAAAFLRVRRSPELPMQLADFAQAHLPALERDEVRHNLIVAIVAGAAAAAS